MNLDPYKISCYTVLAQQPPLTIICLTFICSTRAHFTTTLSLQHWSVLDKGERETWPVGRWGHAAVCLGYGGDHPRLLISGGVDKDNRILNETWILDLQAGRWWRKVRERCREPCSQQFWRQFQETKPKSLFHAYKAWASIQLCYVVTNPKVGIILKVEPPWP